MNALLEDLKARGLVAQTTADEELHEHLSSGCRTLYCGFDQNHNTAFDNHLINVRVTLHQLLFAQQVRALLNLPVKHSLF